jgi:hypothetical protein
VRCVVQSDTGTGFFPSTAVSSVSIGPPKLYTHLHLSSANRRTNGRNLGRYEGVSKIFRSDAVKIINLTTKRVLKLPTSTQLCATWHNDSLDMVVLPYTGASRYHNCCIDGGTSPEYFRYTLVCEAVLLSDIGNHWVKKNIFTLFRPMGLV